MIKMGKIIAKDKSIVVPGEVLAEGMDNLPGFGTYKSSQVLVQLEAVGLHPATTCASTG